MGGLRVHYLGIRIRHIYAVLCWYLRLEMADWRAQTKREGGSLLLVAVEESSVCECVAAEGGNKSASPSSPSGRSYLFTDIPTGTKNNNTLYTTVAFFRIESSEVTRALLRVFFAAISDRALGEERHAFSRKGNKNSATFPGSPFAHSAARQTQIRSNFLFPFPRV